MTEHLWTFAAGESELGRSGEPGVEQPGQCPCDRSDPSDIPVPGFVGNNYFCEAAVNIHDSENPSFLFHFDDPLWDGLNCNPKSSCCEFNQPPYFVNDLGRTITVNSIEGRLCTGGVLLRKIEVYLSS